jgi:TPR repeat protein
MRRAVLALAVSVGLIGAALAGPLEDGADAYARGDFATALRLFRPLADQGNSAAQALLGGMYSLGVGVPQSDAEAIRWFRRAADQGNASAMSSLGSMYEYGHGVPQDFVRAHMWFNLAGSRFDVSYRRDGAVRSRERVATRMTPAQIAEAQRFAREWDAAHPATR